MTSRHTTEYRFSGRAFVAHFGTAKGCASALENLYGLKVSHHTVEKWVERDRMPASVLAAVLANNPAFDLLSLVAR